MQRYGLIGISLRKQRDKSRWMRDNVRSAPGSRRLPRSGKEPHMSPQTSLDGLTVVASVPSDAPRHSRRRVVAGGLSLPVIAIGLELTRGLPAAAAPFSIGTEVVVATDRLNLRRAP